MKILSTTEVSEKLGISLRRVQQLIEIKKLPARKLGRDYVINEEDLAQVKIYGKAGRPRNLNNKNS